MNEREITDFILYWYEKLYKHSSVFIRFLIDEEVDQLLPMNIKFTGSQNYKKIERRIIMIYDDNIPEKYIKQDLDSIPKINRSKYNINIVEWGGYKMPKSSKAKL